jgi:hypothetical protein
MEKRGSLMNALKPEKGEKYIGSESGTVYEWDGEKWVIISVKDNSVEKK